MKLPLQLLLSLILTLHSTAFEPAKKNDAQHISVVISGEVKIKGKLKVSKKTSLSELLAKVKCYESARTYTVNRRVRKGALLRLKLKPGTDVNDKRKIFQLKDGDEVLVGDGLFEYIPDDQKVVKPPEKIPKVFVIRE